MEDRGAARRGGRLVHPAQYPDRERQRVIDRLIGLDHAGRAAIGVIGLDRADLVLPGCAIFAAIHALWPCAQLRVADRGLREGMLRELMVQAHS